MPPKARKPAAKKDGSLNITNLSDIEQERSRIKKARMDMRKHIQNSLAAKLEELKQRLAKKVAENLQTVHDATLTAIRQLDETVRLEEEKKREMLALAGQVEVQTHNMAVQMQKIVNKKAEKSMPQQWSQG